MRVAFQPMRPHEEFDTLARPRRGQLETSPTHRMKNTAIGDAVRWPRFQQPMQAPMSRRFIGESYMDYHSLHPETVRRWTSAGCVAIALVIVAAGCDQRESVPTAPMRGATQGVRRDVGPAVQHGRPAEAPFNELAKLVPSSAGFIYDAAGNIEVFVRDSLDMPAAASALSTLNLSGRISLRADKRQSPSVIIRKADFTFQQLAAWRDTVGNYVDNTPGTGAVSLDLDEAQNRLTMGVLATANQKQLSLAFGALGVDPKALNFKTAKGFSFTSLMTSRDARARRATTRTFISTQSIQSGASQLVAGLSIGIANPNFPPNGAECTLGFTAQEYQNGGTTTGFLTASHCTQNLFAYDGNAFYQPPLGTYVGNEKDDPQGYSCGIYDCNVADASFAQTTSGTNVGLGLIAKEAGSNFYYDPSDLWIITQVEHNDLYVGEQVS